MWRCVLVLPAAPSDSTSAVVARKDGREAGRELSVERIEILDLLLGDGG